MTLILKSGGIGICVQDYVVNIRFGAIAGLKRNRVNWSPKHLYKMILDLFRLIIAHRQRYQIEQEQKSYT